MIDVVLLCPLLLAGVLVAGAIGKLRHPDDVAGWAALGVPRALRRQLLVQLHPWGELLLAAGLVLTGGWLGVAAGTGAVLLTTAYLLLVARAARRPAASCACFGAPAPVTGVTVARNVALLLLAVAGTVGVALPAPLGAPLLGGPLAALASRAPAILPAAALAAAAVLLVVLASRAPGPAAGDGDEGSLEDDYLRVRTPAVAVVLADGRDANLRDLTTQRPTLLLAVSEHCAACEPVVESVGRWRTLLPEVDLRLLLRTEPGTSRLTERTEPQSVHDVPGLVRASIADWPTPTAVLFGADGLLAGGPESGYDAIDSFMADVYESLHGSRPA